MLEKKPKGVQNLDQRVNSSIIEDNKKRKIEKQMSGKVGKDIKKAKKVGNERMTIGAKCVELLIEREVVLFYTKDKDSD